MIAWEGTVGRTRMQAKCVSSAVAKLQLRDGIHALYTRTPRETALCIEYLARQLQENGFAPKACGQDAVTGMTAQKRKRDNLVDATCVLTGMLTVLPG